MAHFGMKVSKADEDVKGLTDPLKTILSSKFQNMFKVKAEGTTSITIANGSHGNSKTIAHGLDYSPLVLAYAEVASGKRVIGNTPECFDEGETDCGFWVSVDSTNIYFSCYRVGTSGVKVVGIKYFILIDPV